MLSKKSLFFVCFCILCLFSRSIVAQEELLLEWQKSVGGERNEVAYSIVETADKGYLMVGSTSSKNTFDVKDSRGFPGVGGTDFWVVKFNAARTIEWSKTFGGSSDDVATSALVAANGDYVIIGTSVSSDFDANFNGVNGGILMIRLNTKGDLMSKRVFAGGIRFSEPSFAYSSGISKPVIKLKENGEMLLCASRNQGSGSGKGMDLYMALLTEFGDTKWEKSYGGNSDEFLNDFTINSDGSIVMVGSTQSPGREITGAGNGFYDMVAVKTDANGNELWKRAWGGTNSDIAYSVIESTNKSFYYLVGETNSQDGIIGKGNGQKDGIVLKITPNGTFVSKLLLGGVDNDALISICKGKDGKYYTIGTSDSKIGNVNTKGPLMDAWLMVFDETFRVNYNQLLGGADIENTRQILPTADGGVLIAASSRSNDKDVTLNRGESDFWMIKLKVAPPILFKSFEAFLGEFQDIEVEWVTQYEKNSKIITLEKSIDNKTFVKIYEAAAQGVSNAPKIYNYKDKNPQVGKNYYRLKYTDTNNKEYFNDLVVFYNFIALGIENEPPTQNNLVYPNPASRFINLNTIEANTEIDIVDMMGRKVPFEISKSAIGSKEIDLGNGIKSGIYFIKIQSKNNLDVKKLIIAK
jgi:hypothetical protein